MSKQGQSGTDKGCAVRHYNESGRGRVLLICEHASNDVPDDVELGVGEGVLSSHAAWDPGAMAVAQSLSDLLDARLIAAGYSRLVYDVNRPPHSPDAIRAESEIYRIPGNYRLDEAERQRRTERYYIPFHRAIDDAIELRRGSERETALVTVHTFSPTYHGKPRAVEIGVLHDDDSRLALALFEIARTQMGLEVALNEPYRQADGVTHTLAKHATPNGLHNVMIEIRNDLVANNSAQRTIAAKLAQMLNFALHAVDCAVIPPRPDLSRQFTI